jgi:hypothetical protein
VTARIAAFIPGASPPLVRTAIRFIAGVLSVKRTSQFAAFALANGFWRYQRALKERSYLMDSRRKKRTSFDKERRAHRCGCRQNHLQ